MEATDYSQEAIVERNPAYEIPLDLEGTDEPEQTMSREEAAHWDEMVQRRPALRCLRRAEP